MVRETNLSACILIGLVFTVGNSILEVDRMLVHLVGIWEVPNNYLHRENTENKHETV